MMENSVLCYYNIYLIPKSMELGILTYKRKDRKL